jgi:hypothetical protein
VTAEIAVMNEEAIALAADSAVTGPKIFTSANKIFALSKYHPVGVMDYASAQFLKVPWETIIKQYRRELGNKSFAGLDEHADHFLRFFEGNERLFPPVAQKRAVGQLAGRLFGAILQDALSLFQEAMEEGEEPDDSEVVAGIEAMIELHSDRWRAAKPREGLPKTYRRRLRETYGDEIDQGLALFSDVPISTHARRRLREIFYLVLLKDEAFARAPQRSGIVIAGFGHDDVFPRLRKFQFEVIADGRLKYTEGNPMRIGHEVQSAIVPFAQDEEVVSFLTGVMPQVGAFLQRRWPSWLLQVVDEVGEALGLDEQARENLVVSYAPRATELAAGDYAEELAEFTREKNIDPILKIVAMLPKDELAAMAESLVNLTSFKRRVSEDAETVGGPIDVAVISRGDGFIWIKRKHYFKTELNPHFVANYYRDVEDAEED